VLCVGKSLIVKKTQIAEESGCHFEGTRFFMVVFNKADSSSASGKILWE
jgi:hypothetical protein